MRSRPVVCLTTSLLLSFVKLLLKCQYRLIRFYYTGNILDDREDHISQNEITQRKISIPLRAYRVILLAMPASDRSPAHRPSNTLRRRIELFHRGRGKPQRQWSIEIPQLQLHELEFFSSAKSRIAEESIESFRGGDWPVVFRREVGPEGAGEEGVIPLYVHHVSTCLMFLRC
jgi:hypothetical protein